MSWMDFVLDLEEYGQIISQDPQHKEGAQAAEREEGEPEGGKGAQVPKLLNGAPQPSPKKK